MKLLATFAIAIAAARIKEPDAMAWYHLEGMVRGCCASFGLAI